MPNKNNKKRQSKLLGMSEDEISQTLDNRAQHNPPDEAATKAPDVNNIAVTKDDPVRKVHKGKASAETIRTSNIAIEDGITMGFASSSISASAAFAGPSHTTNTNTTSANRQTPQQVKEDRIASLRLATEQTNAETVRLQEVLESKKTELQALKDRLRALTGGSKNDYAKQVKIVMRGVEVKRKETRGEK